MCCFPQIFMRVNNSVMTEIPLESGVHKGLKVVVMAPEATTTSEYFVAIVNVYCFGKWSQCSGRGGGDFSFVMPR